MAFAPRHPRPAIPWLGIWAITFWGASFVATRVALEALSPVTLVAVRLLMGSALLGLIVLSRPGRTLPVPRDWPRCLLLGVTLAAHLGVQAYGLLYTSAMNAGWIVGFMPVTIALGAHLLGQQRLHARGWLGVALGTAGVLLVTMRAPPDFRHARFGDLLQLSSCLTWTVYTLLATRPVMRSGALRVTLFAMAVAAVLTALLALTPLLLGAGQGATATAAAASLLRPDGSAALRRWDVLLSIGFLGVLCSGLAYYLWFKATEAHGPTRVAALLYLEPFVTLITAVLLLHEPILVNAVAGGLIVLVGVWLISRGASRT